MRYFFTVVILDGEEWLLSQSASMDDEEIPEVQNSGCAWSVSYCVRLSSPSDRQNKKRQNEDRVYLNSCIALDLQHFAQDRAELRAASSGELATERSPESSDPRYQWCSYQKGTGQALFAMWGRRGAAR